LLGSTGFPALEVPGVSSAPTVSQLATGPRATAPGATLRDGKWTSNNRACRRTGSARPRESANEPFEHATDVDVKRKNVTEVYHAEGARAYIDNANF